MDDTLSESALTDSIKCWRGSQHRFVYTNRELDEQAGMQRQVKVVVLWQVAQSFWNGWHSQIHSLLCMHS